MSKLQPCRVVLCPTWAGWLGRQRGWMWCCWLCLVLQHVGVWGSSPHGLPALPGCWIRAWCSSIPLLYLWGGQDGPSHKKALHQLLVPCLVGFDFGVVAAWGCQESEQEGSANVLPGFAAGVLLDANAVKVNGPLKEGGEKARRVFGERPAERTLRY